MREERCVSHDEVGTCVGRIRRDDGKEEGIDWFAR